MNDAALKAELLAGHPITGIYDADDAIAAGQYHAENCPRDVETVGGQDIFEAVTSVDFASLSDADKALLYAIVGMGMIRVNGANTKAALLSLFGPATDTRTNLAVLQTELVSRAVVLVDVVGTSAVRAGHIQRVRAIA